MSTTAPQLNKTTAAHFATFKARFRFWQTHLGLMSWQTYFRHEKLEGSFARIHWDIEGRVATVQFATLWPDREPSSDELDRAALHECLHLLIGELNTIGKSRFVGENELNRAEETLVVTLANCLKGRD